VAALARGAAAGGGVAVFWNFDRKRWSHWVLLVLVVIFLMSYFGLVSWGKIGDAIESLAENPRGAAIFYAKIDRSDAIFMVFMFLLLTPLALIAIGTLIAFIGAVLTGFFEAMYHRPGMPDWISTLSVYLLLAVVALLTRSVWSPHAVGLASLIARSMIAASR